MKKLILILLLLTPVWAFTQTHTFTEKEVVEMDSLFQVYEQTDSIQKIEIKLLNTWYNKPVIHFFLGAATIVTASWVVYNVK